MTRHVAVALLFLLGIAGISAESVDGQSIVIIHERR